MPHRFLNGGLPRIAQNTGDRFDGHAPIILVALLEMTPFVCELAGKVHDRIYKALESTTEGVQA